MNPKASIVMAVRTWYTMDNIIFRRRTLPWDKLTWKEFEDITFLRPAEIDILKVWNKEFGVSYLEFRAELKRISLCSLRAVRHAICVGESRRRLFVNLPQTAIIVPVDDDDWLAPGLFRRLRRVHTPDTLLCAWNPGRWTWRARNPSIMQKDSLMTANYACCGLRGSPVAAEFRHYARTRPRVYNSVQPFELLQQQFPDRVVKAGDALSLVIKSPASTIELGMLPTDLKTLSYDNQDHRYQIFGRNNKACPGLSWANEYIEMYRELMQRTFG